MHQKAVVGGGGGVIGGFTALYLTEFGHRVTVIERGRFGTGSSPS
jgi:glycine/D-amino acid oxidase-like deaminating enzyme